MVKYVNTTIKIGLPKPLRFLHTTDNHLTLADERDNERKRNLATARHKAFEGDTNRVQTSLDEMIDYCNKNCDLMLHTGDLIDFVSYKNVEVAKSYLDKTDYFMCAGNHEFSQYVGEAWEDEAYKYQAFSLVQTMTKYDLEFSSRLVGGVNLVGLDNGYYYFLWSQLSALKAEVAKGYPILLLMHNPIYTDDLYEEMMVRRKSACAYVCGCPAEKMACYDAHRRKQQQPYFATNEFIDYVKNEPLIKALITGHLHFNYEGELVPGKMQYVTTGGFHEGARLIEVV
ncbi:MAG: metallophosphoesterase [Victivallales bacterium]|nr:metallophosphoesterase [Victivallales bacterium]